MKVSIIDWIIKKLKRCIAIVEEGNTASQAIGSGKYVMWKGNLYTADTAISSGTTLAASGGSKNLTAVPDGGYNDLNGKISTLNSNFTETAEWSKFNNVSLVNCEAHNSVGIKYAKHAGYVNVYIYVKSLTANTRTAIGQLPSGYQPLAAFPYVGMGGASYTSKAFFNIGSDGIITVTSDDTYAQGHFVFWAK